jgi:hypothetical protein
MDNHGDFLPNSVICPYPDGLLERDSRSDETAQMMALQDRFLDRKA